MERAVARRTPESARRLVWSESDDLPGVVDCLHLDVVHSASDGTYGMPRIRKQLCAEGERVSRKRVARLMKASCLRGVTRRRFHATTVRDERHRPAPDLVNRNFKAQAPDQLWVSDITFVPTAAGFLYLAVVLDVFSRKVVGWSMAEEMPTELVLSALDMALQVRKPKQVIHHSDQGCQYTSMAFRRRCESCCSRSRSSTTSARSW